MSSDQSFGSWLKRHRKDLGVTQDELAGSLGCSMITLQKIEGGERHPSRQIALLLAEHLHVPTDERDDFVSFARSGTAQADRNAASSASAPASASALAPSGDAVGQAPWRRVRTGKSNLPATLTGLIGREREVQAIDDLLTQPRVRLLTLTGAPGIGKTRLALQVAQNLMAHFEDGVFLVDLSPVADPDLVIPTIAGTLGFTDERNRSSEALVQLLREKRLLLLLDNFEQILDAAPQVVRLLEGSPWLKLLVTSREALHVRGERRFAVPPLQLPDPAHAQDLSALAHNPAIALFIERAQDVRPDFELAESNAADILAICIRLDGLPLPIELAATRADLLSPREIQTALDSRLSLLAGGYQDLPARQSTLRGAIKWSYDLLGPRERAIFTSLSVFVGGGTLEAVEAVCNPVGARLIAPLDPALIEPDVLESIALLIGKNLLKGEQSGKAGERRFTMLETIREYALEQLRASGNQPDVWRRHAAYYLEFAEHASMHVYERDGVIWLDRLDSEYDNLRAALDMSVTGALDGANSVNDREERAIMTLRLAIAAFPLWDARGYLSEGREWLRLALLNAELLRATGDNSPLDGLRAKALAYAGRLARTQGDYSTAKSYFEAGLDLCRARSDSAGVAHQLHNLATLALDRTDYEEARKLCVQSLSFSQEAGDRDMQARAYNTFANTYRNMLDFDTARSLYERSLTLYRELGDNAGIVAPLGNLGLVALDQLDYAAARRYLAECLPLCRELGHKKNLAYVLSNASTGAVEERDYAEAYEVFMELLPLVRDQGDFIVTMKCMGSLAAMCEQRRLPLEAAILWGAAEALRESANLPMPLPGRSLYEQHIVSARAQADPIAFDDAWAKGRAMSTQDLIAYALDLLASSLSAL